MILGVYSCEKLIFDINKHIQKIHVIINLLLII